MNQIWGPPGWASWLPDSDYGPVVGQIGSRRGKPKSLQNAARRPDAPRLFALACPSPAGLRGPAVWGRFSMGLTMLTLAVAQWVAGLMIGIFLLVSILMILVVLIQRPQGGGLGGAFGGAGGGSGETAFGAKTGDALTIATVSVFILWLCLAVGLVYATRPPDPTVPVQVEAVPTAPGALEPTPAPTTTPAPQGEPSDLPAEPLPDADQPDPEPGTQADPQVPTAPEAEPQAGSGSDQPETTPEDSGR